MKYSKSDAGQQAFKARSALLSARQRSAFILFDGVKSNDQVLAATAGLGITRDDIDHLVQQGFLVTVPDGAAGPGAVSMAMDAAVSQVESRSASVVVAVSERSPQERYSAAMPMATRLTASLGLRGFMLNLAVEGASGFNELLALLPKIQDAVGIKPCRDLEQALKG